MYGYNNLFFKQKCYKSIEIIFSTAYLVDILRGFVLRYIYIYNGGKYKQTREQYSLSTRHLKIIVVRCAEKPLSVRCVWRK
jgi:hypothetical protein